MSDSFQMDGVSYSRKDLTPAGKDLLHRLGFVQGRLQELNNELATLNRAKNGYIEDLKSEVIEKKSGVDLSSLFDED